MNSNTESDYYILTPCFSIRFTFDAYEHLTIIEQKDIINDISSDTGIEPKAIQDMLYSLRNTMEYYSKSATIGEDKNEKFLVRLFPSFSILIEQSKEQRKVLNNQEILVESRIC